MTKLLLLVSVAFLAIESAFAQDTTTAKLSNQLLVYNAAPLITIRGEEIRRFPSNNFLDAVNGLFPGVFSLAPDREAFQFVINGFLLTDINSLSLNDIETVTFSRTNLNGTLFPLSRPGTFYITTRKTTNHTPIIGFNSQYNASFNNSPADVKTTHNPFSTVYDTRSINKTGYLLINQASLLTSGNRWNLYLSAQLDMLADPYPIQTTTNTYAYNSAYQDTSVSEAKKRQLDVRLLAQFTYQLTRNLQVGVSGSYFHGKTNSDLNILNNYQQGMGNVSVFQVNAANNATLPYYKGGAFVDWSISKNVHNRASVEYMNEKLDVTGNNKGWGTGVQNPFMQDTATSQLLRNKTLMVRNELSCTFINTARFKAGISSIFNYLDQKPTYTGRSITTDAIGATVFASGYSFDVSQKITSLNNQFSFSYHNIISGYAGYAFLLNKGISKYSSRSKNNPYAGLQLSLKNLFKAGNNINRLDLSFDYADLNSNNATQYWLPGFSNAYFFHPQAVFSMSSDPNTSGTIFPNPRLANILFKNKLIAMQANAAFLNNSLLAGVEWNKLTVDKLYAVPSPFFQNNVTYIYLKGTETQKAFTTYVAVNLINNTHKTYTVRFNLLIPTANAVIDGSTYHVGNYSYNQAQAGIQNNLTFNNWFAQVNGLAAVNKTTVNSLVLNYLLLGYNFPGTATRHQPVSAFIQARNILATGKMKNYYNYYSYLGAGVNLNF